MIPSKSWPVRPTTDFAREALFNILDNRLDYESCSALELFGGTGIHSIELASRGCRDITYVDRFRPGVVFIKDWSREWNWPIHAVKSDALKFVKNALRQWDYIFADPPYDYPDIELLVQMIRQKRLLDQSGFFVLEHTSKRKFDHLMGFREARHYGQSVFSFFDPEA
jgi:16S rRNA (guanine(966)-N(2))-methyltransferase RsmD